MLKRGLGRKYLRLRPDNPIYAKMSVIKVGNARVMTSCTIVQIVDLSPGGLRFISNLNFPSHPCFTLRFDILDPIYDITLEGFIVHKLDCAGVLYQYGVCFTSSHELLRPYLLEIFNRKFIKAGGSFIILRLK